MYPTPIFTIYLIGRRVRDGGNDQNLILFVIIIGSLLLD